MYTWGGSPWPSLETQFKACLGLIGVQEWDQEQLPLIEKWTLDRVYRFVNYGWSKASFSATSYPSWIKDN